jgi:hypothetical protein
MKEIPIARDETLVDDAEDYAAVLNGIIDECYNHDGFRETTRNEIAVNLTVAAYCLGLDPIDVLDNLVEAKVIDPDVDDEDTWNRVRTIEDYADRFSWDWMLNPMYYCHPVRNDIPIRYKLS